MHRRSAVALSVALVGLSACSGSGDDSGEVPTPSPEGSVDVATTVEPVDTTVSTTVDDDAAEPGGTENTSTSNTGTSVAEFCVDIAAIQAAEFELEETFGPEARKLFDDVQSSAPSEIAGDVATVIATLDAIAELGISTDDNDPVALDEAFEILLDPDFTEASENLDGYTSQACGIDLGEGEDSDIELDDLEGFGDV